MSPKRGGGWHKHKSHGDRHGVPIHQGHPPYWRRAHRGERQCRNLHQTFGEMNDAMAIYLHEGTPRGIDLLKSSFEKVFLVLACGDDGMVCLSYAELKQILDNQHNPIEWISATQHKREMYLVKGSNGELDFKIEQSDFSNKLFAALVLPPLRGLKIIWDFSPRLKPWAIIGRLVPRFQFALICEIRVKEPLRLRVSAVKKKAASVFHLRR